MPNIVGAANAAKNWLQGTRIPGMASNAGKWVADNKVPLAAGAAVTGLSGGLAYKSRLASRKQEEDMIRKVLAAQQGQNMAKSAGLEKEAFAPIGMIGGLIGKGFGALKGSGALNSLSGAVQRGYGAIKNGVQTGYGAFRSGAKAGADYLGQTGHTGLANVMRAGGKGLESGARQVGNWVQRGGQWVNTSARQLGGRLGGLFGMNAAANGVNTLTK